MTDKKIRWYHMMVWRLYCRLWNPILSRRPDIVRMMIRYMQDWLNRNAAQEATPHLKLVRSDVVKEGK